MALEAKLNGVQQAQGPEGEGMASDGPIRVQAGENEGF